MNQLPQLNNCTVAIIGLGYVGLPLAVEFAKERPCLLTGEQLRRRVIGFDVNSRRLDELRCGHDCTNETSENDLKAADLLEFSDNSEDLSMADVFIVTVPTPIDTAKRPDLNPLIKASTTIGRALKKRFAAGTNSIPIVIYESTVYPGATEEVCVPVLEAASGLSFNSCDMQGFACGYSPERINPGDKEHRLTNIKKVTSGSSPDVSVWVDHFYASIIEAGTHLASSIKVAESAKVIENTQRDLNIALVNELSLIFSRLGIDTLDVLDAAGSKWNFLPFRPGLVGGHCIGVDPYYLTHKAEQVGYHPQVVLAGRRINDGMSNCLAEKLVLEMASRRHEIVGTRVLVLGLSFKENCPDLRNTKAIDYIKALQRYGMQVTVVDPWVDQKQAELEYGIDISSEIPVNEDYGAVAALVAHSQFCNISAARWQSLITSGGILFDLKSIIPRELNALRP